MLVQKSEVHNDCPLVSTISNPPGAHKVHRQDVNNTCVCMCVSKKQVCHEFIIH